MRPADARPKIGRTSRWSAILTTHGSRCQRYPSPASRRENPGRMPRTPIPSLYVPLSPEHLRRTPTSRPPAALGLAAPTQ
jgi:hypothetical protein